MALQAPWWSIVASVRQAQIYDGLVASILAAISPPRLPRLSGMEDASPEVQAEIQAQLHSRLEASIRTQIAPLECLAIVHYTLAVGIGTARSLESPDVAFAAERLDAYGPERVRACVR